MCFSSSSICSSTSSSLHLLLHLTPPAHLFMLWQVLFRSFVFVKFDSLLLHLPPESCSQVPFLRFVKILIHSHFQNTRESNALRPNYSWHSICGFCCADSWRTRYLMESELQIRIRKVKDCMVVTQIVKKLRASNWDSRSERPGAEQASHASDDTQCEAQRWYWWLHPITVSSSMEGRQKMINRIIAFLLMSLHAFP